MELIIDLVRPIDIPIVHCIYTYIDKPRLVYLIEKIHLFHNIQTDSWQPYFYVSSLRCRIR